MIESIFSVIVLILDIWAIVNIVQSNESVGMKIVWALLVLILPVIGLIIWYFAGPKAA